MPPVASLPEIPPAPANTEPVGARPKRCASIEYLRGLAALMVVIVHSVQIQDARPDLPASFLLNLGSLRYFGAAGVDIFFVISGFAMAHTVLDAKYRGQPDRFLRDRFFRILPTYWYATLVMVIAAVLMGQQLDGYRALLSLTLLPPVFGHAATPPLLAVGWSLAFEFAFYLVVFAWLKARSTKDEGSGLLLGCLLLAGVSCFMRAPDSLVGLFLNPIWFEFAFGLIIHRLWRESLLKPGPVAAVLVLASVLAFSITAVWKPPFPAHFEALFDPHLAALRALFWGVPSALLVAGAVALPTTIPEGRFTRSASFLGRISFSLYLIHQPITLALAEWLPAGFPLHGDLLILAAMALSVLGAALFFNAVEAPLSSRLRTNRPLIHTGTPPIANPSSVTLTGG